MEEGRKVSLVSSLDKWVKQKKVYIENGLNHGVRFGFMGLVSGLCAMCCLGCLHLHKKFGELNLEKTLQTSRGWTSKAYFWSF